MQAGNYVVSKLFYNLLRGRIEPTVLRVYNRVTSTMDIQGKESLFSCSKNPTPSFGALQLSIHLEGGKVQGTEFFDTVSYCKCLVHP